MRIKSMMMVGGMMAAFVATSLYAAPGGGTVVTHFQSRNEGVWGQAWNGPDYSSFSVSTWDDMNGVAQGSGSAYAYNSATSTYRWISCSGPAYANAVSVSHASGNASANITLDPASPSCSSNNVAGPITISVTGRSNGASDYHSNGTYKQTYNGVNYKGNYQYDEYSSDFNGTGGFASGPFTGSSYAQRNTQRTQVK